MSDTPQDSVGKDTREGGQGPTDIPEESVSSESELAMSKFVADRDAAQEGEQGQD